MTQRFANLFLCLRPLSSSPQVTWFSASLPPPSSFRGHKESQVEDNPRHFLQFKDVVRKIHAVVRLRHVLTEISRRRTRYSVTASQYLALNANQDPDRLTFNKDWYQRGPV